MVCLDWGGERGRRVEYVWPKISLFLANSTLLSSTPPFSPPIQTGPKFSSFSLCLFSVMLWNHDYLVINLLLFVVVLF